MFIKTMILSNLKQANSMSTLSLIEIFNKYKITNIVIRKTSLLIKQKFI